MVKPKKIWPPPLTVHLKFFAKFTGKHLYQSLLLNPINASATVIQFSQLICTANQLTGFCTRTTLAFNGLMKLQVATLLKKETLVHVFSGDFCKNFNRGTLFYKTLPGDCFCFIPIQNFFPLTITLSEWKKKQLMFQVVNDWLNWRFFLNPGNCGIATDLQLERCFGDKKKVKSLNIYFVCI